MCWLYSSTRPGRTETTLPVPLPDRGCSAVVVARLCKGDFDILLGRQSGLHCPKARGVVDRAVNGRCIIVLNR